MKKGSILIVAGIFMASIAAFAQNPDYAFKVLANKGANEVKTGSAWSAVKTGASLKKEDEIKVTENSYLGLVHSSGKPMELKQAGTYKVADLAAKMNGGSSVLVKYTDFILSSNSDEAKKNRLSATGAVTRGDGKEKIKVFLPLAQFSSVYNNIAIINWDNSKVKGPYVISVKNMFDEELFKAETNESMIQIDLNEAKFATESAILVDIKAKADLKLKNEDPNHLIKRLSPGEQAKIKKALQEISGEVKEETALNKLILAGFYEENKLLIDAITSYEQAIKMAPDVPSYKEAYDDFLIRNKLKDPK